MLWVAVLLKYYIVGQHELVLQGPKKGLTVYLAEIGSVYGAVNAI